MSAPKTSLLTPAYSSEAQDQASHSLLPPCGDCSGFSLYPHLTGYSPAEHAIAHGDGDGDAR